MKKVFYDNWLAKIILFAGYSTITLFAWVFTKFKESEMKQSTINHECTHARQWTELTIASGVLLWLGMLIFGFSAWWLILSGGVFYLWYGTEYILRMMSISVLKEDCETDSVCHLAYKSISFEQEARSAENDCNYLENGRYFAWLGFLLK